MPKDQGLYESRREHDACGIGAVVNISGKCDHSIIEYGKQVLLNLHHRGAAGADDVTGDGAGILTQIPHLFFSDEAKRLGFALGEQGQYGVGMVLNPKFRVGAFCEELHDGRLRTTDKSKGLAGCSRDNACLGEIALSPNQASSKLLSMERVIPKRHWNANVYGRRPC
jgi:glutamate synthase domain-containing protein 1